MKSKRIYLSPPHMSGKEMNYIKKAFDENWVAPLGPNVDSFEAVLANYCKTGHAAALSSGTAAIHLALKILDVNPGDEVLASTFTFSATINPVIYLGATPVLVDSEATTWNMDPDLLEKAIIDRRRSGKKVKAIIPVHLYGMPCRMDEIMEVANRYEIPVIEDAAEALGSKFEGKPLGSFGTMGVLSFNGNKIITTSGGGALISDSEDYIKKARFLATQARDPAPHYEHSQIGYNYRMSNVLAGIGLGQMEVIDERVAKRRKIRDYYMLHFADQKGIEFLQEPDSRYFSNFWLTTILLDEKKTGLNNRSLQVKLEEFNIESRPLWKPMHLQPVFKNHPAFLNGNSEKLFMDGLCLPSGSSMTHEDLEKVVSIIKSNLKSSN